MRNGKIILIEDLSANERGLNCGCQCPACDGNFIARMGDVKVRHFAHSKDACDEIIAYTSGLYKLIHQTLSDGAAFFIPPLIVSCQLPNNRALDEETIAQFVKVVRENSKEPNIMVWRHWFWILRMTLIESNLLKVKIFINIYFRKIYVNIGFLTH
jgi:hypothetical protein